MPNLRNALAVWCCLTSSPLFAQSNEPTITYKSAGNTISNIFKEINKQSGTKLECNAGFENYPLIVRFNKAPLADVKAKIAKALVGKWEETSSGSRLTIDSEAWQKLQAEEAASQLQSLKTALEKSIESLEQQGAWDAQRVSKLIEKERQERLKIYEDLRKNNANLQASNVFIQKSSTRSQTPATPAMLQVLKKLSPAFLASIQPGSRVVFASSPTKMQKGFPFASQPIINTFVDAHNLLANTSKIGAGEPDNISVNGGLDLNAKPTSSAQMKMLLVASRVSESSGINLELKFANANGTYVGTASKYISLEKPVQETTTPLKLENSSDVSYSATAKELAKAFAEAGSTSSGYNNSYAIATDAGMFRINSGGPLPVENLSREALAILADPVTHDPQSTFLSEALLANAEENNLNMVACLPDSATPVAALSATKGEKSGDILAKIQSENCLATLSDGWLTIEPKDRLATARTQMNRVSARKLYSQVLSKGYARLHNLAAFSLSLGNNTGDQSFAVRMLKVVDPYVWQDFKMANDFQPNVLKFLGTLPEKALDATTPEALWPVATATPAQKQILEKIAYGNSAMGQIAGDGDMMMIGINDGPRQSPPSPGLADEPTESMPNGIPGDARVRIKFSEQEIVKAFVKGKRGGQFLTAMALGGSLAMGDKQLEPSTGINVASFDSFLEAGGNHLNVYCEFTPKQTTESDYQDAWLTSNSKPVTLDGLSKSFREALEKARESMKSERISFGQPAEPPPH